MNIIVLNASFTTFFKGFYSVSCSSSRGLQVKIHHMYRVQRKVESDVFRKDIDNVRTLFHASRPANFVGILSRGLLLPKVVVGEYGGKRTDPGMLGCGLYFSDAIRSVGTITNRLNIEVAFNCDLVHHVWKLVSHFQHQPEVLWLHQEPRHTSIAGSPGCPW